VKAFRTTSGAPLEERLTSQVASQKSASFLKKKRREVPEAPSRIAASLEHLRWIIEAEAKHLIGMSLDSSHRLQEAFHLTFGKHH
jgi:hypothetical protein